MVKSGCLPLIGVLFVMIGCVFPDDSFISNAMLILGFIIFLVWIIAAIASVIKDSSISELWNGFLDYLAETFEMLIVIIVLLAILLFLCSAFGSEGAAT